MLYSFSFKRSPNHTYMNTIRFTMHMKLWVTRLFVYRFGNKTLFQETKYYKIWFFVSFRIFLSDNTRVRIFIFCRAKREIFFPEFNIRLYDKNSESDYFFFLHQNQNIFFSKIGNQNIFLEKNHNPPSS
jgi:hypothetical protein